MQRILSVLLFATLPALLFAQPGSRLWGRLEYFGPPRASVTQANPLVDSLVAYYGMEESSGTRYDGIGNNHLTAYNSPGDTAGVIGRAVRFDNSLCQYLATNSPNMAVMQGDWSLMFWAKDNSPSSATARVMLTRGTGLACNGMEYVVVNQTNSVIIRACDATTRQAILPYDTAWHHIAIIYKQTLDSVYVYKDGIHLSSLPILNAFICIGPFTIGAINTGIYPFYGCIDEVYYWRGYALTTSFLSWYVNSFSARTLQEILGY